MINVRTTKAAAAAAALSVTIGVFGAAAPGLASSSASPNGATTVQATSPASAARVQRVAPAPPQPGTDRSPSEVQKKGKLGPIISWIRKHAPQIWKGLKAAVKEGYKAFKNFWNDLPRWIRVPVGWLWSGGLWELFDALWHYFF